VVAINQFGSLLHDLQLLHPLDMSHRAFAYWSLLKNSQTNQLAVTLVAY